MEDELLYTQEDIDEWMRTCDNLQEHLSEERENIKDLEQQLAEKNQRIAELEDKDWYEACIKQLEDQNGELINELAEKDKEIAELNVFHDLYLDPKEYCMQGIFKQIRKQVCDKIRKFDIKINKQKTSYTEYVIKLNELLDKIEQGE